MVGLKPTIFYCLVAMLFFENAPEFVAKNYKINHQVQDTLDDFTDIGKKQMSFMPW